MLDIRTYEPSKHLVRMLIYGGSGIGKTVFCASAPRPLFLAVEEGLLSLADKGVQYARIRNLQDLRDILAALKAGTLKGAKDKALIYDTIVIDSLTEVQQVVINNITGGRRPSMTQWGDFSDQMAGILKGFCALDCHLIFTCLEAEKNDEDDEGREYSRYQPELYGKLAEKTMAMMDFVGRYYMKTEVVNDKPTAKRILTFAYSPRYRAKDRSGKLPQFADPDFSKLMTEYAKIKLGDGKMIGQVQSQLDIPQPTLTFPPEHKDLICSKEQQAEIKEAWKQLMRVYKNGDGNPIPSEKHDAYLGATMQKHCGVKTTTMLRAKQATQFFNYLLDEIKKQETPPEETSTEIL